jgi:hypothetical protein
MRIITALVILTILTPFATAATTVQTAPTSIHVTFDNGTKLEFALQNDILFGLQKASVAGIDLKSAATVQRPILAQDMPNDRDRMIWPFLRFKQAKVNGAAVELECELLGTSDERALQAFYVYDTNDGKPTNIRRDAHTFPMTQQPESICRLETLQRQATDWKDALKPAGTLTWIVAPDTRNIAGWVWNGWKQNYRFTLDNGRKIGAVRSLGTWEIGGTAVGLTAVNMRYRGLGRIEQAFTAGPDGGVKEAWLTSETLPGVVKKAPAISPVVPTSVDVSDRGFALQHRAGAWITRPARGAGVGFVDFQYRPEAALCSFPEKQGNLRASSECFPGDRCLSQTDEELFARTEAFTTQTQTYLALPTKAQPLQTHESRTRWQEVDQYVRDLVSAELKFVQYEPLPGVGVLADNGWADYYKGLAKGGLDGWAKKGVRLVAFHNPGWINGRYQGPKGDPDTPRRTGGGVCLVYDWTPAKDIAQPWKDTMAACARNGIAMYPWVGNYNWGNAAFAERVGKEPQHWSVKADGVTVDDNQGVLPHNYLDEKMRTTWLETLEKTRSDFGFQGFWVDSFQSTGMHRFTPDDALAPQQRVSWELWAVWSRKGAGLMAESHAFPGLSCSIEIPSWKEEYWFFQHVWRWYRGDEQKSVRPEELDRLAFRFMANKCWTAPDMSYRTDDRLAIPSFDRLAHEYLAALPSMRLSYILPDEQGVLWLPFSGAGAGVWFAFSAQPVPTGVTATPMLGGESVTAVVSLRTYRVTADDVAVRFAVRRGPEQDPRLGQAYTMPQYVWPDWAKK